MSMAVLMRRAVVFLSNRRRYKTRGIGVRKEKREGWKRRGEIESHESPTC